MLILLIHVLCWKANPSSAKVQMFNAIQNLSSVEKQVEHVNMSTRYKTKQQHMNHVPNVLHAGTK